jgi:hypothetical protein
MVFSTDGRFTPMAADPISDALMDKQINNQKILAAQIKEANTTAAVTGQEPMSPSPPLSSP